MVQFPTIDISSFTAIIAVFFTSIIAWGAWVTKKIFSSPDRECLARVEKAQERLEGKLDVLLEHWGLVK